MATIVQNLPRYLQSGSEGYKNIVDRVKEMYGFSHRQMSTQHTRWNDAEKQMNAYIDATDRDEMMGNKLKQPFETKLYIPYGYAIKETLLAYLMTVLGAREPLFQLEGVGYEDIEPAKAMETIIAHQSHKRQALLHLHALLHSGLTYGVGWVDTHWEEDWRLRPVTRRKPIELFGTPWGYELERETDWVLHYEGNDYEAVDPYRVFPDPSLPVSKFQEGKFVIRVIDLSYEECLMMEREGVFVNVKELKRVDKGVVERNPEIFADARYALDDTGTSDSLRAEIKEYNEEPDRSWHIGDWDQGYIRILEAQVTLIPREWGLGSSRYPQKWIFSVGNGSTLLRAAPLDYAHNQYTLDVVEYAYDPFSHFNYGVGDIVEPLAALVNWLISSHIENVKLAMNGFLLYNPAMIDTDDLDAENPLRWVALDGEGLEDPAAIERAMKHFPVADMTQSHIGEIGNLLKLIRDIVPASDAMMGIHPESKRTATEFAHVSAGPVNRMKIVAETIHAMGLVPWIDKQVQNNQQYMSERRFYRILGRQAQTLRPDQLRALIGPEDIQGSFDIMAIDGSLPLDKVQVAQTWIQLLGIMAGNPLLIQQYNLGAIVREIAISLGRKNIDDFLNQPPMLQAEVMPNAEIQDRAAEGQIVPLAEVLGEAGGDRGRPQLPSMAGGTGGR